MWTPDSPVLKVLLGLLLVVHGLIHLVYFAPANDPKFPMTAGKSWLVTSRGLRIEVVRRLVAVLAVTATVAFCLLALSYFGLLVPTSWFTPLAVAAASASLLLIAVTWNVQFIVGVAIDVAILYWALA